MDFKKPKQDLQGLHQFLIQTNSKSAKEATSPHELSEALINDGLDQEIVLLLHGYSEDGTKIFRRLGRHLEEKFASENKKVAILAPNGLYPMPKAFPLAKEIKTAEDLLQGFAWYFYHAATNTFLIDYKVPSQTLGGWLHEINPKKVPVTIIGYSQGGYLAPFVALNYHQYAPVKRVVGINCAFREDLMKEVPHFPMHLVQGDQDTIIETALAKERFEKLIERGMTGSYHSVEGADHKLTPDIAQTVSSLI